MSRIARRAPVALLAAFTVLAVAWSLVTPVFEAPDESTHFFVAQHIARMGELPVQTLEVAARGPWEQEGSQPPLYYALAAPLLRLSGVDLDGEWLEERINPQNSMGEPLVVGNDNRFVHIDEGWPWPAHVWAVRLARGLSILLGLVAVAATWALAVRVLGGRREPQGAGDGGGDSWDRSAVANRASRPWLALAVTALFAFNPQMIAAFSALSNDPAIIALAALALWLLARLWDGRDDQRTVLGLALVVGLAPLAKVSGLALVAFALATVAWLALRGGRDERGRGRGLAWGLRVGGAIVAATLLLAGWWYLRNLRLYGSLTGLNYMLPEGVGRELNWARWLRGLPAELLGIWRSSWGLFGWFTLPLPAWAYALVDAATAAAAAGLAWAAWRSAKGKRGARDRRADPDADVPAAAASAATAAAVATFRMPWSRLLWLALWWGLMFAALLRWLLLVKGGHGRLLFPAWAAVALLLVVGWRSLLPPRVSDRTIALTVTTAMLALSTGALLGVIRPAFAAPPTITEAEIPASATRVDAVFGEGLRLLAVEHPERVVEGELLPVTLYWQVEGGVGGVRRPGLVALRLDQIAAITGEDPDGGGRGATNGRPRLHRFAAEAYLAHPGAGALPIAALPSGRVIVDRHRIPAPMLVTTLPAPGAPFVVWEDLDGDAIAIASTHVLADGQADVPAEPDSREPLHERLGPGAAGPDDPARRFAMPVEARLSIHVYDRDAGEAWPVAGADAAVGGAGEGAPPTDVERRLVLAPRPARPDGRAIGARVTPVAELGEAGALRLGLVTSVTEAPAQGRDVLYVADARSGWRSGQDEAGRFLPSLEHIVPDPRSLAITWSATRIVWTVERALERDLALFVHLVDDVGAVVGTFDGDPVTHGVYPSSRWRAGDLLVADLGWAVPEEARPGDRFTLLVGLYERVEGTPRLPAFASDGARFTNDAVPLVAIEVGAGQAGAPVRPGATP